MGVGNARSPRLLPCHLSPLAAATYVSDITATPGPVLADPGRIEGLAEKARCFAETTGCFIGATHARSG